MDITLWDRQPLALKILSRHMSQGRLSHAYLLTGDNDSPKVAVATEFARSLLCENSRLESSCGCNSCQKFQTGQHADFHWIGQDAQTKSIKIAEIREALEQASMKPFESARQIFLIQDANRFTTEAANALLKNLEEPAESTFYILTTSHVSLLLPTILSRCFEVRIRPEASKKSMGLEAEWMPKSSDSWIDALDEFSEGKRPHLQAELVRITQFLRDRMNEPKHASFPLNAALAALDAVLEAQDALDSNSNQKLTVSRLELKLETHLPLERLL